MTDTTDAGKRGQTPAAPNVYAEAQARAVRVRNRKRIESLVTPMCELAASSDAEQSVAALARKLECSKPTVYRRFGHRDPVGGAYVMAACVQLTPVRATVDWALDHASSSVPAEPVMLMRGLARCALAIIMEQPRLMARADAHARRGVDLRRADLDAILERPLPETFCPSSSTEAVPVTYIPVLVDAVARVLVAVGRRDGPAVDLCRSLIHRGIAGLDTGPLAEANRFLDLAVPMLRLPAPPRHRGVERAWLLAQLAESLAGEIPDGDELAVWYSLVADHG